MLQSTARQNRRKPDLDGAAERRLIQEHFIDLEIGAVEREAAVHGGAAGHQQRISRLLTC